MLLKKIGIFVMKGTDIESQGPKNLVIMGAGGFAREVAWLVADINRAKPKSWNLIGFCEREAEHRGQLINGIPVIGHHEMKMYVPNLYAVAAIGDPKSKERAVREAESIGCRFAALVHPTVQFDQSTDVIGHGSIICAGNILTVNITIGEHVTINPGCFIGHDTIIEDYVNISPVCHIAGYTTIRRSAFIGIGATTIEKHEIGSGSIIGAGAVVITDIPSGVTALGVPAKVKEKRL